MNVQGNALVTFNTMLHRLAMTLMVMTTVVCSSYTYAGDLNISNNVLELTTGVEPNIVIFTDESPVAFSCLQTG